MAGNIVLKITGRRTDQADVPALLQPTTRGVRGQAAVDAFLGSDLLKAKESIDLSAGSRGVPEGSAEQLATHDDEVLVIELADGGTLITNPERLRAALQRNRPDLVDGDSILFDKLNAEGATLQRGIVGDAVGGLIKKVVSLVVGQDDITSMAAMAAQKVGGLTEQGASRLGTKALMWAIEEKLDRPAGHLYAWVDGSRTLEEGPEDKLDKMFDKSGKAQPALIFIHGTGSSTLGSFGDLQRSDRGLWTLLENAFPGGIFGFEHRTLSESPIENALQLVNALPKGARVSLVTHSRGGLVGDLLCLQDFDAQIEAYRFAFKGVGDAQGREAQVLAQLHDEHVEHRKFLQELFKALREKKPVIERYVRVASPAQGTRLASGNFDVFLSGMLTLIGRVPYFFGNPLYSAFKRVVIEVARNRTDAHLVPGIEAMLPDSPMAALLRDAPVQPGIKMALIAGDIQGGNLLMRMGVMLTDFLLFDNTDNDLVVDTAAMLGGVAAKCQARVLFDRASDVSHFNYFSNLDTRSALRDWLIKPDQAGIAGFIEIPDRFTTLDGAGIGQSRDIADANRPIVVVLPGVMGTYLNVDRERIWLDPLALVKGRLDDIAFGSTKEVTAGDLFGSSYRDICEHLAASHRVVAFPYDWRQPLDVLGERLGTVLELLLKETTQPIRLLAHSMGGLVVRACIYRRRDVMDTLMRRDGARLVMLGTPHQGSHAMVENLLGKGRALRTLARLDLRHDMQQVLNIVAGFRGALQLLPKPDFIDTFQGQPDGGENHNYGAPLTWTELQQLNTDLWFGDRLCGLPDSATLDSASWLWTQDKKTLGSGTPLLPEAYQSKSIYVFGVAANTPCGVRVESRGEQRRLRMVGTTRGDGTVTWDSGRIGGIGSFYYLPALHGDLLSTKSGFAALGELLVTGATSGLDKSPPVVRSAGPERPVSYDPGPPNAVDAGSLAAAVIGGSPGKQITPRGKRRLEVDLRAMDLRFVASPILVGHYENDPIAGAEALIDCELMDGELTQRHALGLYAGPIGSAAVVLRAPNEFERRRGSLSGAVVTGLGRYEGTLSQDALMLAVRAGVLRFLLQVVDVMGKDEREVSLASLLLGYNSSANLTVSASVEALVRGVLDANEKFKHTTGLNIRVARLDIVELYLDTAISAVYELRQLAPRLQALAQAKDTTLMCGSELIQGIGLRQRLFENRGVNYWPRLIVTDADRDADESRRGSDLPPRTPPCSDGVELYGGARAGLPPGGPTRLANRIRFLYVGQRARAESVVQQRQPSLIETLVQQQINGTAWKEDFGRMLFQLIVPPDFKEAARQLQRIVLVVDSATANLPWELMLADPLFGTEGQNDGPRLPLAIRTPVVRQLTSTAFRRDVRQSMERNAYVVGNPSVTGFAAAFPDPANPKGKEPDALPGAEKEATAVADLLRNMGYDVRRAIGADNEAATVLAKLYSRPFRVLHISAHGIFDLCHADGQRRSGVVLSGGLLITAAEIDAMECVPELVFLNCCHLGEIESGAPAAATVRAGNKLAASVARELIDIGVRCVVVAGWAVHDGLAQHFGEIFYKTLLQLRKPFGEAVFEARKALWDEQRENVTWGAFQAYGDPLWVAEPQADGPSTGAGEQQPFASLDEMLDLLARARADMARRPERQIERDRLARIDAVTQARDKRCPPTWLTLPALQSALGAAWRDLGCAKEARDALLAAIQAEDVQGRVPIRDIEQLANVEVKLGVQQAEQNIRDMQSGKALESPTALEMIDYALKRLTALDGLVLTVGESEAARTTPVNAERAALLGSGYKRKAAVHAMHLLRLEADDPQRNRWLEQMTEALHEGIAAYSRAEGVPGNNRFKPYNALNRLALSVCVDGWDDAATKVAAAALAKQSGQAVSSIYTNSADPWDAVMQPESVLVERLCDGSLAAYGGAGDAALAEVMQAYHDALTHLGFQTWQIETVVSQMEVLSILFDARFWMGRGLGYQQMANRVLELVKMLQPARASRSDRPAAPLAASR